MSVNGDINKRIQKQDYACLLYAIFSKKKIISDECSIATVRSADTIDL